MAARKSSKSASPLKSNLPLDRYRAMRDFGVTTEPRGGGKKRAPSNGTDSLPFVVQKHAATRLHYDFRLGWRGVLKSWAVTKGPSYFPGDKRLAVQVEDHPIEYGDFEGTIPKGQYGGGTVMVWDTGTWTPQGDVDRGLQDGHLKFELHGKKLKGKWALIRMHSFRGRGSNSDKPNWLLIKEKDPLAREASDPPITDKSPNSAATGRTLEQIAKAADRVWNSSRNGGGQQDEMSEEPETAKGPAGRKAKASVVRKARALSARDLKSAKREEFPGFIAPQLAQLSSAPPSGAGWVHEIKFDGYRIQVHVRSQDKGRGRKREVRLLTRKGLDWTSRMPDIANAAAQLEVTAAILDGEAVALDEKGISNFADLQAAFQEGRQRYITYFAFDLLHLDGYNLRGCPLMERKRALKNLLDTIGDGTPLRYSESFEAEGEAVFAKACALGAEGVVSKLVTAKYTSGRGNVWLKLKCHLEQEFVIGGFTLPSKGVTGIGALLLGYYASGKLRYAGRCGTGFTQKTHRSIRARLDQLVQKTCTFAEIPRDAKRDAVWVRPELIAEISFANWTRDDLVRQASFKGLREDKATSEVVREAPAISTRASRSSSNGREDTRLRGYRSRRENTAESEMIAQIKITHPEKILDPESGMTKQQLAEYYVAVAELLLPHIANRPLSVVRCPDGNSKPCFFQKHVGMGLPAGVGSVSIRSRKTGEKDDFLTVDSAEGLIGLAQMGVLEIHPWGSQNDSLEKPDRIVFDLDPDVAIDWPTLSGTAQQLHRQLKKMGLESFLKSTGGKGLHVVVPVLPTHEWPVIKEFAHNLVLRLQSERPDLYVTKMTKATRKNRIYLDYLRNDRGSTSVAAYSPRARSGAPVAMPLHWKELNAGSAPAFHVTDFPMWRERLRRDPWKALSTTKQDLSNETIQAASHDVPAR